MSSSHSPIESSGSIRRTIMKQAWPILISQWAGISFAVLDTMMLGNYSPESLQAMSLAASIYITIFISLTGVIHALIPIFSQLIGAKKFAEVGVLWSQGVWLGLILSLTIGLLILFPDVWLSFSGNVSDAVRAEVNTYLQIVFISIPAGLIFRAIYSLATSSQRPKHIMYISVIGIVVKAALNWVLIFGHLGLPSLGSTGAALSTTIVSWVSLVIGLFILFKDPFYCQFQLHMGRPQFTKMGEILKLGIPMGGSYLVEVSAFTFMALLAAREGTYVSGGHQIFSNLAALLYMMPMSIGVATASLSAQAVGAQQLVRSHQIAMCGLSTAFIGALLSVLLVVFAKSFIISLYTSDAQVALVAAGLLSIAPLFHFGDVYQCINTYILRAHKIATFPFVIQALMLSGLGLGGGYFFGYGAGRGILQSVSAFLTPHAALGVSALWIMCILALYSCSVILHLMYHRLIYLPKIKPLLTKG